MGSRRQMETWMDAGRVQVNGEVVAVGARATPADAITVDGAPIPQAATAHRLLLYYKPVGKVVSQAEEDGESVFGDLPEAGGGRWLNLGRLDINSEGLLLFSNNGNWVHKMTHPKHGVEREYRVRASGALPKDTLAAACRHGIKIGKSHPILPRRFVMEREGGGVNCWYRIVLSEGRNRAVRRIFEHYGLNVSRLMRVRFGAYTLPADLAPGEWQEIPPPE